MCAIVDNDVRDQVFGNNQPPAGKFFFDWLNDGRGRLVIGGKLLRELSGSNHFRKWIQTALLFGRATRIDDGPVNTATQELRERKICQSNDEHILGLAKVSGARLLFTNDHSLQQDFKNRAIIGGTRGRIYTMPERDKRVTRSHESLLKRRDLCNK